MALDVANIVPWKWDIEKGQILCDVNKPVELSHEITPLNEDKLSVPDYEYFAKICKTDRERVKESYKKLIQGDVAKIKEEYRVIVKQDNKTHYEWVEAQAAVDKKDKAGKALSLVGSSLVITKRKKMEEDLIKAKEKAEGCPPSAQSTRNNGFEKNAALLPFPRAWHLYPTALLSGRTPSSRGPPSLIIFF